MPGQLEVTLTKQQRQELEQARDHHPKPYVREAAAAILKVAAGQSARQVALFGLLRVRDPESVSGWIGRYQQAGIKGLLVSNGRGRKASFSPRSRTEASQEIQHLIGASPAQRGEHRSRWWLAGIRQHIAWLQGKSLSTVWRWLDRLEVVYKRGRRAVHSPDPAYDRKLADVAHLMQQIRQEPQRCVVLYQDELTYYRRPTVAHAYAGRGSDAPRAWQGWGSNTRRRIGAVLDAQTGQVLVEHHARCGRHELIALYRQVQTAYPHAERIFIVQDNWPVHVHPDIRAALRNTRITLVALPTYAPWTNPIEKLWRWLYHDVLHLHSWAEDWSGLQSAVAAWLSQFHRGSLDLLHYVGLYPF